MVVVELGSVVVVVSTCEVLLLLLLLLLLLDSVKVPMLERRSSGNENVG